MKALFVECIPSEEVIRIVFEPYTYGMAPILIVNCLKDKLIIVSQNEEKWVH